MHMIYRGFAKNKFIGSYNKYLTANIYNYFFYIQGNY